MRFRAVSTDDSKPSLRRVNSNPRISKRTHVAPSVRFNPVNFGSHMVGMPFPLAADMSC